MTNLFTFFEKSFTKFRFVLVEGGSAENFMLRCSYKSTPIRIKEGKINKKCVEASDAITELEYAYIRMLNPR